MTGEGNGRATVSYEDEETADKAITEYNGNPQRFFFDRRTSRMRAI